MQESRGYSMPYLLNQQKDAVYVVFYLILAALVVWMENQEMIRKDYDDATRQGMLLFMVVFFVLGFLGLIFLLLAKLHFVPQGVAVTLFGMTLRRVPLEEIQVISAVAYSRKGHKREEIALCLRPLEEVTTGWGSCSQAEAVYAYLKARTGTFWMRLNLDRDILWLEWSPERLKLLQKMYPHVPWMDGSPDKRFDNQL